MPIEKVAPGLSAAAFRARPKVELHRHLEGSLRTETLWALHTRHRQTLHASRDALHAAVTVPPGESPGLPEFLSRFSALRFFYGSTEIWERLAAEAVEDAAADGVVHLELRFSPAFCARRCLLAPGPLTQPDPPELVEAAAEAVVRGGQAAAAKLGIGVGFIVTLGRQFSPEVNASGAALLERPVGSALLGLDLAGPEACPAAPFAPFFAAWKAAGKGLTIHAGEDIEGPGPGNVREAVEDFRADRIGHGLRAAEDPALLTALGGRGTTLELCPTSNVQTRACARMEEHPFQRLRDAGVKVTINADDPSICQTTLSEEYACLASGLGLSEEDLFRCTLTAAEAAFLCPAERAALIKRVQAGWQLSAHVGVMTP